MKNRHIVNLISVGAITIYAVVLLASAACASVTGLTLGEQYAISKALGEHEHAFHASPKEDRVSFINNSQKFMAMFSPVGDMNIVWQQHHITMRFTAVEYGEKTVWQPGSIHIEHAANRIVYDQGPVKQWFVNGPMGLQQGFTINKRPGKNKTGKLVLTLNVNSDLQPRPAAASRGVDFVTTDEEVVLQYTGLMVVDADTKQLPAHIETHRNQIDIVVDDRKAVYPVIVDPIFQQAKLTASDGAGGADLGGDWFGYSIAVDGNTIVVGAPEHDEKINASTYHIFQGTAYVFEKSGGSWTEVKRLRAFGGKSYERFGKSVAIDKDVIVVGATITDSHGSAYIFVKSQNGWPILETAKLTSWFGGTNDWFGYSVAIEGDTVVVGSMQHDVSGKTDQGEACVFVRPAGGWIDMTKESCTLRASDGKADEFFGRFVSISNNTIIVGSDAHGTGDSAYQGAVYVYEKPDTGWVTHTVLTEQAKLMASDGAEYDHLGYSVAIDGNTIVAGAPGFHSTGKTNLGAAYVFVKSGTHWIDMEETAEFRAADGMEDDFFGHAVAIDGNTIVIGSPYHNRTDKDPTGLPYYIPDMGAVYTFSRPSGGWHDLQTKAAMISSDGRANDHLGKSVAISGSTIIAGAPDQDLSGKTDQGAAYVFHFKKKNAWPMFISAVTSHVGHVVAGNTRVNAPDPSDQNTKYTKFIGTMTLEYGNTIYPHFDKKKDSFCTLWMPVNGDVGQLTCSPEILSYDETEEDGTGGKYRFRGSINFQPTGSCKRSTNTCRVADGASGSETQWWWTWYNGSWEPLAGTPWTGTLDGFGNTYDFGMTEVLSGGETIGGTVGRTLRWTLWLMPAP